MNTTDISKTELDKLLVRHSETMERLRAARACPAAPGRPPTPRSMAARIEHTLLSSAATDDDVRRICREAESHAFRAVCCFPRDVATCKRLLEGTVSLVVTVVDFPLASGGIASAEAECARVVASGADEVDMVIDVRALKQGNLEAAADGVGRIVAAAQGRPVKVILETALLTREQIVVGAAVAEAGGAAFVKTSTGFAARGASVEDIVILRAAVGDRLGIKASGGIRDRAAAELMVEAGADLVGTSNGPKCVG